MQGVCSHCRINITNIAAPSVGMWIEHETDVPSLLLRLIITVIFYILVLVRFVPVNWCKQSNVLSEAFNQGQLC